MNGVNASEGVWLQCTKPTVTLTPKRKKAPMILGGFSQFTVSFHELVGTAAPADGSWDERSQLNSFEDVS